jgi:hypothetical protein
MPTSLPLSHRPPWPEHHFNRRYGPGRRDVYLLRTETGWQVLGREGGAEGREVVHYVDDETDAS